MNWLHQNFPGQYVHAARHLVAAGDNVCFITQQRERQLPGVRKIVYAPRRRASQAHSFVRDFETAVENGLAVAAVCEALKREGFRPDLVVGHNGWGEILYVKDCWPGMPLLGYFTPRTATSISTRNFRPRQKTACVSVRAMPST